MSSRIEIVLDEFAFRQFDDANYAGTKVPYNKSKFEEKVNEIYEQRKRVQDEYGDRPVLVDGYAPFCKHLFVPNFVGDVLKCGTMTITPENEHLIRTRYEQRTENELPVLVRYFPREKVSAPVAKHLDLILYSREQINKESEAMGTERKDTDAPWGLISIKAQDEAFELPMQPITIMRNELISQGGSGVPVDRDEYMKSVDYWRSHAAIA
eukprot:CAMPEP_0198728078 /NCGR_PEP_ID=MMETSP1475-20131203/6713_1 /TAXON_ID= ORGANISM="Unidentified sp., Strain CCMP1999" /NCGR_SAMPLE_ID=MMETSP1475 /ASSEMBLY_ACC=CAM_ASM_001111 /LENGTH=209 /DNA_ID=CAMNT_0044490325 /DNA_START=74 /DNA_END=703 /DNA_ORIENTATION=-